MSVSILLKPNVVLTDNNPNSDFGVVVSYNYENIKSYLNATQEHFDIKWKESQKGVFMISFEGHVYTYWPKTGKWRARHSTPIYRSRDIHQFFMKYVLKNIEEPRLLLFDEYVFISMQKINTTE